MRLSGRISAAIEVLTEIADRHRPASEALKDWGKAHRFAGSSDRHAIGTLVYDALRKRNSLSHRMGSSTARALAIGVAGTIWHCPVKDLAAWAAEAHGFGALSDAELGALAAPALPAPAWIAGDYPEWLDPEFTAVFGDQAAAEGAALSERAPIDVRVNALKSSPAVVLAALKKYGAVPGPLSPLAVRIAAPGHETRNANVEAEPGHGMGWYEVQDAASQAAALLAGARTGETVADICAGAGGKTLALAAAMENGGKLIAHDSDRFRLRPIFERITRAGAANIEVIAAEHGGQLDARAGGFDCVLIDAPCSGSGAWRRKPDAKWRLTDRQLQQRLKDQAQVLDKAARLVKPGGRMVYITCSVLNPENQAQVEAFLARTPGFAIIPYAEQWARAIGTPAPQSADLRTDTLLLTPRQHNADGFFVAVIRRGF